MVGSVTAVDREVRRTLSLCCTRCARADRLEMSKNRESRLEMSTVSYSSTAPVLHSPSRTRP